MTTTNNKNNALKILNLLNDNEISKEELLNKLKIKQSTFYKHLKSIKKSGFNIDYKDGIYQLANYKNIIDYTNCECSVFAYLYTIANSILPELKIKKIKKAFLKMFYFSNEKNYNSAFEKYDIYKTLFQNNNQEIPKGKYKEKIKYTTEVKIIKMNKNPQENETFFELYDKLIKSYRLKENERVVDFNNEKLVIASSNPDKDELFRRLLRYDTLCKVIFPKKDVNGFKKLIEKSLANINEIQDNID